MKRQISILLALICALSFTISTIAVAQSVGTITGIIKDPAGAVVAGAQVTARNDATGETRNATTNDEGRFRIEKLAPGSYTVIVTSKGFKPAERKVVVDGAKGASLEIRLEIEAPREEIKVGSKGAVAANSEPTYRAMRDGAIFETYTVNNLTLKRDVGTLTLRSGHVSFLAPVMNRVVKAVFVGDGEFALAPAIAIERDYLRMVTEKDSVAEPFEKAVFCFTDETYQEIKKQSQAGADEPRAKDVLRDFQERVRYRPERPRSFIEAIISGEAENIEAEILTDVYNAKRAGFFSAYIFGRNLNDLRFHVRPRGALPRILSPEEVALINIDLGSEKEGIWYLAHNQSEYTNHTASSEEDKRVIDAEHYRIETVIDGGEKLTASAEIAFRPMMDGDRVIGFGLLPNLRVTRVTEGEREIDFIQEARKEDGSFYVVMPEPMTKGQQYKITIEYQGNKVVEDAGGGNFAVFARTSWYPSVNAFNDRATFDLTFKVPNKYTLVGVGKLVKEWREGDYAASQWVSEIPLAVAGFNYGLYKKKVVTDEATKYQIEGYATSEVPDYLRSASDDIGAMSPTRLLEGTMVDAQNSIRVFNKFFGEASYGRIAITQQPQFNFGQSWPTLVYLPIVAYLDSTQRYMLLGRVSSRLTDFIDEVASHEVAHQWWGHMVGWASYHDQWLSEGFADFSASLFLLMTQKTSEKYLKFWENHRKAILEKNQFGRAPNDAGPLWMGLRLNTYKTPGAYGRLVYPKGGYILHMLRTMFWAPKTGDEQFIAMMKDFVQTYLHKNASSEGFKQIVEKHMTPKMDLDGNKRMDWFFNEWVYGTDVPRYKLEYTLTPDSDGKVMLKCALTQSGVSEGFKMLVPVYLDFDGKLVRLGLVNIYGNSTEEFQVKLPQKPKRVLVNAYHDVLAYESTSAQK
ncbi:MAG TPA: carboxypeptidase regulatory-like domain-containing protein [Blastocatellia bacterium]|nr:carboxypeptidase regulatory-like domain-containing protein [Blastocatellia bacterium]